MSAERLRDAAQVLRDRAEAATAGPWETECIGSEGWAVYGPPGLDHRHPKRRARTAAATWGSFESDKADSAYIATMHPGVGLALADLLDYVSRYTSDPLDDGVAEALAVANAILGGRS